MNERPSHLADDKQGSVAHEAQFVPFDSVGYVDGLRDTTIHGWAANRRNLAERVSIQLKDGQKVISEVVADINRDDLLAVGYSDARHGFAIDIPDEIKDGQVHELSCVVVATGEALAGWSMSYSANPAGAANGPVAASNPSFDFVGYVDGLRDNVVYGWVLNRGDEEEHIAIQLRDGQTLLREVLANGNRDDLSAAGYSNIEHGFAIAIPDEIKDGQDHELSIVLVATGEALAGWKLIYSQSPSPALASTEIASSHVTDFVGYVDGVRDDIVYGWVLKTSDLAGRVGVRLIEGAKILDEASADIHRDDLSREGYSDARHGFALSIPDSIRDGQRHDLSVVIVATGEPVVGSNFSYIGTKETGSGLSVAEHGQAAISAAGPESPVTGHFDGVNGRKVTGWAFDRKQPSRPVELYVSIDGIPKLMIVADRSRSDVAAAGFGDGHSGFEYDLPDAIFDGDEHEVAIVIAETGEQLPGRVAKVKLSREGAVFFDRRSAAIDGWARNARNVVIRFDGGSEIIVRPDRKVSGFLSNEKLGFRVPIPSELLDNAWHRADAVYGNDGLPLDGSPIMFRLSKPETVLDFVNLSGRRVFGRIYDVREPTTPITLSVEIDGAPFATIKADSWRAVEPPDPDARAAQEFSFLMPAHTQTFALRRLDGHDKSLLASWRLTPELERETPRPSMTEELSRASIRRPETFAAVKDAFARFVDNPSDDFDEAWYLLAYPEVAQEVHQGRFSSALEHYATVGARTGYSPSAYFDEAGARAALPPVSEAVEAGDLHSAFALYLHMGKGDAFDPVSGFASHDYLARFPRIEGTNPLLHLRKHGLSALSPLSIHGEVAGATAQIVSVNLPDRLADRDPAASIYAAWMCRIELTPEQRATLASQETSARHYINTTGISRAPLVSIIMPTFNRAYTLGEAIQSVLDQSYQNWELLICDDASTDKTPIVVAQFQDPRIRYMQFEKSNGAETRNKGLRYAQGEYIAYLDSDNLWDPLFLDVMIRNLFANPGQSVAYAGYLDTVISGATVQLDKLALPEFNGIQLSKRNFIDLNTLVHHRRAYDWLGGFDKNLERLQDWDLVLRYTSIFNPVFVPYCLAYYRRNIAWGQVTHLFLDSNVQSTVAEKTASRLEKGHVRLAVHWPSRPKLAVLAQGSESDLRAAAMFAKLAAPYSDIVFMSSDPSRFPFDESFGIGHVPSHIFQDPARLGYALAVIPNCAAVVSFGSDAGYLRRLFASGTAPLFQAKVGSDGVYLVNVIRHDWAYHLGALPLSLAEAPAEGDPQIGDSGAKIGTLFPLRGKTSADQLEGLNVEGNFAFLLPPPDLFDGPWSTFQNGTIERFGLQGDRAVAVAKRVSKFVISGTPVGAMSFGVQSFLFDRMGSGLPTLLVPDVYGSQLAGSGAVYGIDVPEYSWIFEKLPKLFHSEGPLEKLRKNARRSYLIRMHPELVQERVVNFIHQLAFSDKPEEVVHVG